MLLSAYIWKEGIKYKISLFQYFIVVATTVNNMANSFEFSYISFLFT